MLDINELYSNRIGGKNFSNNNCGVFKSKNNFLKLEEDVLDFSSSESYKAINDLVIKYLCEEVKNNNFANDTELEFNKACSAYLRIEQSVDVDHNKEITECIGIKEALNILPLAFINSDDYIITTSPGCNILANMGKWLNCNVYKYKLNKFNNYLIDFESIDENILKKCKMLYINYPNDPTGAVANKEFFKEVIKYAKKYNFIVIHDASYIDLCFDKLDKISFLSIEGAKDVGIELYGFSKNFNMKGFKIGFIAGNKDIIKAYKFIVKDVYLEQFSPIKKACIKALNNYDEILIDNKNMYLRRHKLVKEVLENNGFKTSIPKAGFYQYVEIPKSCNGVSFESASEFALWLMENVCINVIPYDDEGKYIRFSMAFQAVDEEEEKMVISKLDERLKKYKFEYK